VSPRPDVGEERKKQILDAATIVFSRQGYDKTRMDDIAQEAGLSKGSLYWYFKSKKDLFLALLGATTAEMIKAMSEIDRAQGSASERIRLLTNPLREMMGGTDLAKNIAGFFLQHQRDESVQKAVNEVYRSFIDLFAAVIRDGIASGEFREDFDAEHAASALAAAFDGLEIQVLLLPELDWQTLLDQTVEIFLRGMTKT
jgi:TetR/AcrR family fatty acid metabolism transcriptional regulator